MNALALPFFAIAWWATGEALAYHVYGDEYRAWKNTQRERRLEEIRLLTPHP